MLALIGQKKIQSQRFLENGRRIPVTLIDVKDNTVIAVKTADKDKYQAVQLGFSMKKKATKAELGHAKGAKLDKAPKFLKEVKIVNTEEILPEVGTVLVPSEVFAPGDIVDVSGFSKGKGFAGAVKRHGFHGGPKTHGQSDRHRAPGSVGQGTTPGRVYRGKRMAGNMGNDNVTVKNLEVIDITDDGMLVLKGLVPGIVNGLIMVKKVGEDKKFVPLQKTPEQLEAEEKARVEAEAQAAKAALEAAKDAESAPAGEIVEAAEASAEPAEVSEDQPTDVDPSSEPAAEQEVVNAQDAPTTQDTTPQEAENVENVAPKEGDEDANK
jgi:large subunit ribosomal protein L3